jgi:hypothetical protein
MPGHICHWIHFEPGQGTRSAFVRSYIEMGEIQKYRDMAQALRARADDPRLIHDRTHMLAMAAHLERSAKRLEDAVPAIDPPVATVAFARGRGWISRHLGHAASS